MNTRRHLLALLAATSAVGMFAEATSAQAAWPEKPVSILVSFPPGGASDLVARLLAQKLSDDLGQQFVVENKPGAAGTVAAGELASAGPDGYTFMLSNLTPFSVAPTRFPETPYDPIADFDHITYVGTVNLGLFVTPELGVTDLAGFLDAAKADPGSVEYGSSGVGSWVHIIAEQFNRETGAELFHIPYKGSGPMRLDFRAGVVPAMFDAVPQNLPAVEEGTAVPLAVSATERLKMLPDVPTFSELGYDIVAENWLGVSGPKGVPEDVKATLDAALQKAMNDPEVMAQFDSWGLVRAPKTSAEFEAYVGLQFDAWKPLVEAAME